MDWMQLYQDVVLRHNRAPVGFNALGAGLPGVRSCRGDNPLCGEHMSLHLQLAQGAGGPIIEAIGFSGELGAMTTASASMLCSLCQGLSVSAAQELIARAYALVLEPGPLQHPSLGEFNAFSVVANYPNRIKTITLPWACLSAALAGIDATSTDTKPRGAHAAE